MTREEAIDFGKMWLELYEDSKDSNTYEFFQEAIKALEQQSCKDAISRNEIIRTLNNMDRYVANELILCDTNNKFPQNEVFIADDVYEQIDELSPVTSQPKMGHCKDCKWWKDSDGAYRRGAHAESQCPINTKVVCDVLGYCYMFEPQESEG